jgi:hypothetical protein
MSTISSNDPRVRKALQACVGTLRRLASYQLPPSIEQRLQALGEQKEFLDSAAHDELMALVAFSQQRTLEKLEAEVALRRLEEAFPEVVAAA